MLKRKLQVFVSSTFIDLKEERQSTVEAILNAGHIPAGMELFTAGDESQWNIIKRWIEESDVYMLILGGRYGSIEDISKKSYTHLEYEYAIELGKPFFAIVISDKALDEKVNKEGKKVLELDNQRGLKDFKKVVTSNMCAFWDDLKDIKLNVNDSIRDIEYRYADSLKGWVKADDTHLGASLEELARLSKENNELKSQLAFQNNNEEIKMIDFLKATKLSNTYKTNTANYTVETLFDLFMGIAYEIHFDPDREQDNNMDDINRLKRHDLLLSAGLPYTLSDKGKSLYSYVEVENIERQEKPIILPEHPFIGAPSY